MTTMIDAPAPPDSLPAERESTPPAPGRLRRLVRGRPDDPAWARPALLVLLGLTAVLYLWNLSASGWGNSFYAAAAQAGSQSWKAWLFGSLDAGNAITVDKPPAALWVMGLSARIFGVNSWSILAPQALMGVASVGLLYATVRRWSGPVAGLLAGAALALTPVAVLMFRFDNPDALLVLLEVAAAYATVRAVEKASWRWLSLAGVFLGFGFLTKMMQAFLVLPALALVYLVAAPAGLGRRIRHLLIAGVALIVSAGWFVALVELWPASSRPFIAGSTNNSLWELAIGYNGLSRLLGGSGNGGGSTQNSSFGGATGLGRLFGTAMGTEISWLLPAALIALVAVLVATWRQPRTDRSRAAAILWGGWLLVTGLTFSFMSGTIHPYYTVALAPAIAALVATGARVLWLRRAGLAGRAGLAAMVLASAIWGSVLLGRSDWLPVLRWGALALGVVAAVALLMPSAARLRKLAVVAVLAGVLATGAGTAAWATATASTTHSGSIPASGPASVSTAGGGGMGGGGQAPTGGTGGGTPPGSSSSTATSGTTTGTGGTGGTTNGTSTSAETTDSSAAEQGGGTQQGGGTSASTELTALLEASTTKWSAAISGATSAAELELASGTSVIALGGWNGSDPSPTLAQFQAHVAAGQIHYFISGGQGGGGGGTSSTDAAQIATWVAAHYTATTGGSSTVYDLTATATSCPAVPGAPHPHPGMRGHRRGAGLCALRHRPLSPRTAAPQGTPSRADDHQFMRRRTLLGGLVAASTGAATGYATTREQVAAAATRVPTDILSSTKTSRLAARPVTVEFAPAPGTAPAHRFAVGRRDFGFTRGTDRPLPTRVWYPATGAPGGDVLPAAQEFPLILFSHGLNSQPNDFTVLLTRWARAGFVVAAPIYPHTSHGTADFNTYDIVNQPADATAVITEMLALNDGADPLAGRMDPGRVAAAGHSAGGITTAGLFSAVRDPRLKAGIILSGTDFRSAPFTGSPAALLFAHGEKDDTVAYAAARTVFEAVPWSRAMLTVPDGDHQIAGGGIEAVTATSTEFLRWSLYGDRDARHRLPAKAAIGAVATLDDQLSAADPRS